jgi:hypothetical protein
MDIYYDESDFEEVEHLQAEFKKIIKEYKTYLEGKGSKKGYIDKQLYLMKFFGYNYLINYTGQNILEIDEYDIYEFLGR